MTGTRGLTIPAGDLRREAAEVGSAVQEAIERVTSSGWYLIGPELEAFESEFASWLGVAHAVGVHSGTDALMLALAALGVGPGDEVVIPAMTSVATATAVLRAGAEPVLADIDPVSMNLDPKAVAAAITPRTRALIPVHLYGRMAAMPELQEVARHNKLLVVEDACQAHGAYLASGRAGTLGDAGCFSFYPSKNLGAYGDGGLIVTRDEVTADRLRRLRQYGWRHRDRSEELGWNSRLDELQAAILRAKLPYLEGWNRKRAAFAHRYASALAGAAGLILPADDPGDAHHLFVVRVPNRDALRRRLADNGIGSSIHYPLPIHRHPALVDRYQDKRFPVAESVSATAISLPLFPQLTEAEVDAVVAAVLLGVSH